jgi:hypothetical protein
MGSFIASRFKSFTQHLKHVALSLAMVLALATAGLFSADAEASKRLGSGGSSGKQSSIATQKLHPLRLLPLQPPAPKRQPSRNVANGLARSPVWQRAWVLQRLLPTLALVKSLQTS